MKRVLVVDDDRLVADTLTLIFEKRGSVRGRLTRQTRGSSVRASLSRTYCCVTLDARSRWPFFGE